VQYWCATYNGAGRIAGLCATIVAGLVPALALAQAAAPITITPPTLAPERRDNGFRIDIPQAGAIEAPRGAEDLTVTLGAAQLVGGFAEMASATDPIMATLTGRRVTLAQIYAAASQIEAAYARAGYVLARVSVPPQQLREGGDLRIALTDGFIEAVDVSGLPARIRRPVLRAAGKLRGRAHVRMRDIEQALMIASDSPGLALRSTLMRGAQPGGTRLVLEGTQQAVSADFGADNAYAPSLGTYGVHAELTLNSLLGLGEQIYGFVASGYDVSKLFANGSPAAIAGGGVIVPLGDGQFGLNPEITESRTRPAPVPGAPQTVGLLRRQTVRSNWTLLRTRTQTGGLSLAVERIDEINKAPDFDQELSHDRYMVARLGASLRTTDRTAYALSLRLAQGLGNLAAISANDAVASGVPFSRQGSATGFTTLNGSASVSLPLVAGLGLLVETKAQSSFGKAVFRAEQFVLEGTDGVSAYVGGVTTVDEGGVARIEVSTTAGLGRGAMRLLCQPYVFAAGGLGRIDLPSALEPDHINAASFGLGARTTLGANRLTAGIEFAHGIADFSPLNHVNRLNVTLGLHV